MSSHDLALRGQIGLMSGVTLKQVWEAVGDLAEAFDIELDRLPDTDEGAIEFVDPDNVVELNKGVLFLDFSIYGIGHGTWPEEAEEMVERLCALAGDGGALELFDTEVSPTNEDESYSVRFVGATDLDRKKAQVRYGMSQAEIWLRSVIGPHAYAQVFNAAMNAVDASEFIELKVTMRSKMPTFGTDVKEIRVWSGQSVKEVTEEMARSYGAEVDSVCNLDGTPFTGDDLVQSSSGAAAS